MPWAWPEPEEALPGGSKEEGMRIHALPRLRDEDLRFEGEHLVTVDDREWLGITPNWWELSLYRTRYGAFVLGSTYYQNYPRGGTVYGAWELPSLDHVARCLQQCGAPDMIAEALLLRARRCMRHRDTPLPPVRLRPADVPDTDGFADVYAHLRSQDGTRLHA